MPNLGRVNAASGVTQSELANFPRAQRRGGEAANRIQTEHKIEIQTLQNTEVRLTASVRRLERAGSTSNGQFTTNVQAG